MFYCRFFFVSFVMILVIIIKTLAFGDPVSGWPSLVCIIFFVSGVQLFCLGIIGAYLSKTYLETKERPIKVSATEKSDKKKNTVIIQVDNKLKFSKRYIKYLVKKFLRKEGISRFLTVSATSPNGYTVKVIKKNEE